MHSTQPHLTLPRMPCQPSAAAVIFQCTAVHKPTATSANAVDATEANNKKKPKPAWIPCEKFNETECEAHKAVCARCEVERKKKGPKPM